MNGAYLGRNDFKTKVSRIFAKTDEFCQLLKTSEQSSIRSGDVSTRSSFAEFLLCRVHGPIVLPRHSCRQSGLGWMGGGHLKGVGLGWCALDSPRVWRIPREQLHSPSYTLSFSLLLSLPFFSFGRRARKACRSRSGLSRCSRRPPPFSSSSSVHSSHPLPSYGIRSELPPRRELFEVPPFLAWLRMPEVFFNWTYVAFLTK